MDELAHHCFRFGAKGALDAPLSAEQIGDNRITASLHSLEQERGSSAGYDPPVNFGHFQIGIYFDIDGNDIVFSRKQIEKCAQVRLHQVGQSPWSLVSNQSFEL
jgi:hypothetical protein